MRNQQATKLLFEMSREGRRAHQLPPLPAGSETATTLLPADQLADAPPPLPELAEGDVVRHFVNLSTLNMSVDTHFYPLGSCTMKYNPKRNERMASLPGLVDVHPLQADESIPGCVANAVRASRNGRRDFRTARRFAATGRGRTWRIDRADGRGGLLHRTGRAGPNHRSDSPIAAHGTNPASAQMAGFSTGTVKSNEQGLVDLDDLKSKLDEQDRRFHDHQSEHARTVRFSSRQEICRAGP